ncbi:MAG: ubiquinone/menaquinone biosynthesis methyltransferase [Gemmatimonadaceae bacterium]|nr:ubiquinone/menaquinone biosynthesis methyltransferase [Gemmatimonadaceae bacterium]
MSPARLSPDAAPPSADEAVAERAASGGDEKRGYVQSIFSQIAPRYDLLNHLLSFNIDKRWRRRALRRLGWERAPAGVYLDVCAGTLDVGATLVRTPGFAGSVIGADFAEPMLRAGAGKASPLRLAPVTADALQLPLADDSVDGAIVAFGIRNVADLDAGLREVRRVLKPGARFVILEFTTPRSRIIRAGYHLYFHRVLPFVGGVISGHRTAYAYLPKSVANFPEEAALARRMTEAGYREVVFDTLTFGIAAVHAGTK